MKLVNLSGPQDVIALLVRRKWWVLLPFIGLSAAVILITAMLPPMFVSQSLIIITPRDVPNDFVKDLLAGTTAERLSIITERLLSDSTLQGILKDKEFEQIPGYAGLNLQQMTVKLRRQIDVQFSGGEQLQKGQLPSSAFRISYQNSDNRIAQKLLRKLIELFSLEDSNIRQQNVNKTAEFFQSQVNDRAARLAESNAKLKEIRIRFRNELPTQLDSNLHRLETLSTENNTLRSNRTEYVLRQGLLEQQLSGIPRQIPKSRTKPPKPEDPKVEQYRATRKALKDQSLLGRTNKHPEVTALQRAQRLQEEDMTPEQVALGKEDPAPAAAATEDVETMQDNPAYRSVELTLETLRKQIESIDERIARNEEAIQKYNLYVNNTPHGEQELTDVLRENTDLMREHQELNAKLSATRLSASAADRQGTQFEVLDQASLPITPTKPSKSKIMVAGFVFSLLVGLGLAVLVDVANQKTWTQSDITHLLGVKVLAEVPRIATRDGAAKAQKKRVSFATSVGIAGIAYAFFLYFAYAHPGFVIRQLDPLIQKLY